MANSANSTITPVSQPGPVTRAITAMRSHEPDPTPRRSFLGGLLSLPMVGGTATLVVRPTAAAEPATRDLLIAYADWLHMERSILLHELLPDAEGRRRFGVCGGFFRYTDEFHLPSGKDWKQLPQPSTRAALVLSAVGCDWRR